MLIKVLVTACYARHDTRTPVAIGVVAMVANMVFNLLLVIPLHMYWKVGHMGLSLATTFAAYLNAGLLLRGLGRREIYRPDGALLRDVFRIALAVAAMCVALLPGLFWLDGLPALDWHHRVLRLTVVCVLGIAVYGAALALLFPADRARLVAVLRRRLAPRRP